MKNKYKIIILFFLVLGIASCGNDDDVNNYYEELYKIRRNLDNSFMILSFFSNFNKACGFDEV
jgi:hypothetical protein